MIRFVACTYTCIHPPGCSRHESRNTGASPFSFTISVLGSFTCIAQHTGPTALRPIRRTKQLFKCLAQGHKHRDQPGRDSNPHSDNIRTWVQCTRPLGHDTPRQFYFWHPKILPIDNRRTFKHTFRFLCVWWPGDLSTRYAWHAIVVPDLYTRNCFSASMGSRFGGPGQKALQTMNKFALFVDFYLIE